MSKKIFSVWFFSGFLLVLISGCTFTTTSSINVEFSANPDSLSNEVLKLIPCEHINVKGTETKTNGKHSDSQLRIEIMNPKGLPEDENAQDEIGMKIARLIKPAVKNVNVFDDFEVLFVFQTTSGVVTSTKYTGHTWKLKDL